MVVCTITMLGGTDPSGYCSASRINASKGSVCGGGSGSGSGSQVIADHNAANQQQRLINAANGIVNGSDRSQGTDKNSFETELATQLKALGKSASLASTPIPLSMPPDTAGGPLTGLETASTNKLILGKDATWFSAPKRNEFANPLGVLTKVNRSIRLSKRSFQIIGEVIRTVEV